MLWLWQQWGLVTTPPGWVHVATLVGYPLCFCKELGLNVLPVFPNKQVTLSKQLVFFTYDPLCHLSVDLSTQSVRICP